MSLEFELSSVNFGQFLSFPSFSPFSYFLNSTLIRPGPETKPRGPVDYFCFRRCSCRPLIMHYAGCRFHHRRQRDFVHIFQRVMPGYNDKKRYSTSRERSDEALEMNRFEVMSPHNCAATKDLSSSNLRTLIRN